MITARRLPRLSPLLLLLLPPPLLPTPPPPPPRPLPLPFDEDFTARFVAPITLALSRLSLLTLALPLEAPAESPEVSAGSFPLPELFAARKAETACPAYA